MEAKAVILESTASCQVRWRQRGPGIDNVMCAHGNDKRHKAIAEVMTGRAVKKKNERKEEKCMH